MKCPKCNKEDWWCDISQGVSCSVDNEFEVTDVGFDFSDPTPINETVACGSCGFEPHNKGEQ